MQAEVVVINTDVDGVMTGDPRIVHEAQPVRFLSYTEALELAIYGTGLFHPRTMLPLLESGVPMLIRNTMRPDGSGTIIWNEERSQRKKQEMPKASTPASRPLQ